MSCSVPMYLAILVFTFVPVATTRRNSDYKLMMSRNSTRHLTSSKCDTVKQFTSLDEQGSRDQCTKCVKLKGCKYCPYDQTCIKSGSFFSGGRGCTQRKGKEKEDEKLKSEQECKDTLPSWAQTMEKAYGKGWKWNQHIDAVRCLQWALGFPVDRADQKDKYSDEDIGRWGCTSAIMRAGILAMLDEAELSFASSANGINVATPRSVARPLSPNMTQATKYLELKFKVTRTGEESLGANVSKITWPGVLGDADGLLITGLYDGALKDQGVLVGDILTRVNDVSGSYKDLTKALKASNVMDIEIRRTVKADSLSSPSSFAEAEGGQNTSSSSDWWYSQRETYRPPLCAFLSLKLKAEENNRCYVRAWQIEAFVKLYTVMGLHGGESDIRTKLVESVKAGPITSLNPGAGKSGSTFATLGDEKFKLKMGLKYYTKTVKSKLAGMNEPGNLMKLLKDSSGKEHLYNHFQRNPDSLLNRIYGMLKISFGGMRSYCIIMDDAFYHKDADAGKYIGDGVDSFTRYDLKGASRNQQEKAPDPDGFSVINYEFKQNENAQMKLSDEACTAFRTVVNKDAIFLGEHGMIDYSLLLMSAQGKRANTLVKCDSWVNGPLGPPYCMASAGHVYTVSIIDYLNDLNAFKSLESWLHHGKFNDYAGQLSVYAKKICPLQAERIFKKRIENSLELTPGSKDTKLQRTFSEMDADSDGVVKMEELRLFLQKKLNLNTADIGVLLDGIDSNEDGTVGLDAFKYLFE